MLGEDVVKKGLHVYFDKYQWQNTILSDFVGCLNDAYKESGNEKLGKDFDFLEWCDEWLTTSGVNILEPELKFKPDGSIHKISIKQSNDLRGKNILRRHKVDIAIYDENFKPMIIKDFMIDNKQALNDVDISF